MNNLYGLNTKFTNNNGEVVEYIQFYVGIKTTLNTLEVVPIKILSKQKHVKITFNQHAIMFDSYNDMLNYLNKNYVEGF